MTKAAKKPRRKPGKSQAGQLGERALRRLAWLMENASSEQAQVAAAKELVERSLGRSAADTDVSAEAGLDDVVKRLRALRAKPLRKRPARAKTDGK